MKKSSSLKLSLRKLFVAMLAVGPLAILPSPVWATLPTATSFTVTNGSATVTSSGSVATINASDRAVLVWGFQNATASQVLNTFTIGTGETYNFSLPSSGAVLNKVGYAPGGGLAASTDTATINGSLQSNGRVIILANGGIAVGNGATISTSGGLLLSTLAEASDFNFTATGNLALTGTSTGSIALGNGTATPAVSVVGNLAAYGGTVTTNNLTVLGDMVVNQTGTGSLVLTGTGPTSVSGNLTAISAATSAPGISQGTGALVVSSGTTSLTAGNVAVTLTTATNDFKTVTLNVGTGTGGNVTLTDANDIAIGASTIGQDLSVTAGNKISTSGAVAVGGNATLNAGGTGTISFASNSSVGGSFNATAAGNTITANTIGNLTTGTISAGGGKDISVTTSNIMTVNGTISTTGNVSLTGANVTATSTGQIGSGGVASVIVTNSGVGYTSVPTVTIGGGATGTAAAGLSTVVIGTNGTGYTALPTVTISGGGATTNATATANGAVASIPVATAGTGYTAVPTVTISQSGATTNATASPLANVTTIPVTTAGAYTVLPSVSITGANTTAAVANPLANVTAVGVTSGGSGFTASSTTIPVTFSASGATTPATGHAISDATGVITSVVIDTVGAGYTSVPTVTFGDTGTGVVATATSAITGINISNPGAGYTATPTITLSGGTATTAAALGASTFGVPAISVTAGGVGLTAVPSVTFSSVTGATAPVLNAITMNVTGINVTNGGVGYTSAPTVAFSPIGGATAPSGITDTFKVASVSVTAPGTGITTPPAIGFSVSGASTPAQGAAVLGNGANAVTVTSKVGDITLPGVVANTLTLTSAGNIGQVTGSVLAVGNSTSNALTANAVGNITLNNNNVLTGGSNAANLTLTGNNVSLTNLGAVVFVNTNTTGNLAIDTSGIPAVGTVQIGQGQNPAASAFNVGGTLNITTNGSAVSDDPYVSENVFGAVTINTANGTASGANVTINASDATPVGATARFGQWNINAGTGGNITISETTAMNLGNVTGNAVAAKSVADVLVNGQLTTGAGGSSLSGSSVTEGASGNMSIGAGGIKVGGNVTLGNASNVFGSGLLTVNNGGNDTIVSGSAFTANLNGVTSGTVNLTTTNPVTLTVVGNATDVRATSGGKIVLGQGSKFKNVTISANDTSATSVSQNGTITLNGTMTITSAGNVSLVSSNSTSTNNVTGSYVLANVAGDVALNSSRNLTVSGTSGGTLTVTAGAGVIGDTGTSFANPWNLTLGNLNVKSLSASASNHDSNNSASGNSGSINQAAGSTLHVEGTATFSTFNGDIVVANAGNSAGRVQLYTGGGTATGTGNVTYAEDATVKLGNVATTGLSTITSQFGSIINDSAAADVIGAGGAFVLSAPNGSVTIGTTPTVGTITGNITSATITAAGAASLTTTSGNLTLGAINANSLTVKGAKVISQSAPLNIFGAASFESTGDNITLTNSANNFGPISLKTVAGKNLSIVENGTMNLRTVVMPAGSGNFTANAVNGDIIDTGLGGVVIGGTVSPAPTAVGSGVATLTAANGNIVIDDPTSDFPTSGGVVFNAKNVTLSVLGQGGYTLALGSANTTSVAGNLSVTSVLGDIGNAGNITVSGLASFQTGTKNISLAQSGNSFGTIKFSGNQVSIQQTGDMKIATGSQALGAAQLATSSGNITIANLGGLVTFGNTAGMSASGNITLPKLITAVGTLTVNASGTKDLSALSISGDLGGKTPVNLGAGAYLSPQP